MMDVPIWHQGRVYGVLCFEHVGAIRKWQPDEQDFAINMTEIASSCIEASAHLAASRRWETVVESLSEGVIVMDPSGKVVHCNSSALRLLRDGDRSLSGREELVADIDLVDAADRLVDFDDWPLPRAIRNEAIRGEIYGVVFKRTGERRYVRVTSSPVLETGRRRTIGRNAHYREGGGRVFPKP